MSAETTASPIKLLGRIVPPGEGGHLPDDIGDSEPAPYTRAFKDEAYARRRKKYPRVVVQGDSWFAYPLPSFPSNIVDLLPRQPALALKRLEQNGATLGDMTTRAALAALAEAIGEEKPACVLLSAGGNDLVEPTFLADLFLTQTGTLPPAQLVDLKVWRTKAAELRDGYDLLLKTIRKASADVPVLGHGYDYLVPSDKRINLVIKKVGPWIQPALVGKKILNPAEQEAVVAILIDRFNQMVAELELDYPQFRYLNLRGVTATLKWHNEMHPNKEGFQLLSDRYAKAIEQVL